MEESRRKLLNSLSRSEQIEILKYLSSVCFSKGKNEEVNNYQMYRQIMLDVSGIDIAQKSRSHFISHARFMVLYRMRLDGNSLTYISKVAGLDHSTVVYAIRYMEDMFEYPSLRKRELVLWEAFINKYKTMIKFDNINIGDKVSICCNKGVECEKCKGHCKSEPMTVVGKMASLEHTDQGFFYLDFLANTKSHWVVKPSEICNYKDESRY